ncbi:MAG TPA: NAD(P)-binding domain-containing protein [Pseudonocardiaceae bacterium]
MLGEFTAAGAAYRSASARGLQPQPGLALLRLAQGRTGAALAAIRRVVGETTERHARARQQLQAPYETALARALMGLACPPERQPRPTRISISSSELFLGGITQHDEEPAMSSSAGRPAGDRHSVDTLVIGGGQAGLATSYWLTQAGVEHLVVERRDRFGGGWLDRWDSFCLVAPNFVILLPGMPYAGPDPDGFMARDEVVNYLQDYAASFAAPVQLGTTVNRLCASNGDLAAHTDGTTFLARNVVLATGPYQRPKVPAASSLLPGHIQQLHSQEYRRPEQLAGGAVLVVGTGQSGTQIAEELHRAGRDVHLAVSMCASAPRRYRGRDVIWWLLHCYLHGAEVGVPFPSAEDLPSPAARFGCDPHVSGKDGGHDINLRRFARQGVRLYGRLESAAGARVCFSDDLDERLAFADRAFDEEFRPMFDAYIAAAGVDAPPDDRPPYDDFTPATTTELDLDAAGVGAIVWATGYQLDFGWVDLPVLDEWGYPRHRRGVTTHPGLYAVGLRWLHSEPSSVLAGVGADAAHIVEHLVGRQHRQ